MNLLKARMVELGVKPMDLAKNIGMGRTTMYSRLEGKSEFTVGEVRAICEELSIEDSKDIVRIFLS